MIGHELIISEVYEAFSADAFQGYTNDVSVSC